MDIYIYIHISLDGISKYIKKLPESLLNNFLAKVLSTLNFLGYFFSLKMKNKDFASRNCYNKNY